MFNSPTFFITETSVAQDYYRKVIKQNNKVYLKVTGTCEMVSHQNELLFPLNLMRQGLFSYLVPIA